MKKQAFIDFIEKHRPQQAEAIVERFAEFQQYLWQENSKVNLISRQVAAEDYWTAHLLDSILPIAELDFSGLRILDFGSGGGLPGIPLKLIFPTAEIYCLDSRRKKMISVQNMIKKLDLSGCFTIVSRLEELDDKWLEKFDLIVCRSVKILPQYKQKILALLKPGGRLVLYKSKLLDDVKQFENSKIYDLSHPGIGTRKIIEITK